MHKFILSIAMQKQQQTVQST